jgi:hypothetical protein
MDVVWGPEFSEPARNEIVARLAGGAILVQPFVSRCARLTEVAFHLAPMAAAGTGALRMDLYRGKGAPPVASATLPHATLKPEWNVFCFPPIDDSRDAAFFVSLRSVDVKAAGAVRLRASGHDPATEGGAELNGKPLPLRAALRHGCVDRTVPGIPAIDE